MSHRINKKHIIATVIMMAFPLFGQVNKSDSPRGPILKSLLLPGLGHLDTGHRKIARKFLATEGSIWATLFIATALQNEFTDNLRTWAVSHAGNTHSQKPDLFYFNMGQYTSLEAYNEQMMRERATTALYPDIASYRWSWDSAENQAKYRDIRRISINARNVVHFAMGALVLNRAVSAIHALYLHRMAQNVTSWVMPELNGVRLGFTVDL